MTDDAPGRRDLEFHEQIQQPVDDDLPLDLASSPERLGPEEIERAPDQLEVEAESEAASLEPGLVIYE